jgi:hypothetical protein
MSSSADVGVPGDFTYAIADSYTPLDPPPYLTVDNMLGLSEAPGPTPRIRSILVQPGVPQGTPLNP